jgi:hypothetical protein
MRAQQVTTAQPLEPSTQMRADQASTPQTHLWRALTLTRIPMLPLMQSMPPSHVHLDINVFSPPQSKNQPWCMWMTPILQTICAKRDNSVTLLRKLTPESKTTAQSASSCLTMEPRQSQTASSAHQVTSALTQPLWPLWNATPDLTAQSRQRIMTPMDALVPPAGQSA